MVHMEESDLAVLFSQHKENLLIQGGEKKKLSLQQQLLQSKNLQTEPSTYSIQHLNEL